MTVEVQINHYDIRVLIDGLPQVYILRSEFVGFEIDKDYYDAQEKRFKNYKCQMKLF